MARAGGGRIGIIYFICFEGIKINQRKCKSCEQKMKYGAQQNQEQQKICIKESLKDSFSPNITGSSLKIDLLSYTPLTHLQ